MELRRTTISYCDFARAALGDLQANMCLLAYSQRCGMLRSNSDYRSKTIKSVLDREGNRNRSRIGFLQLAVVTELVMDSLLGPAAPLFV